MNILSSHITSSKILMVPMQFDLLLQDMYIGFTKLSWNICLEINNLY